MSDHKTSAEAKQVIDWMGKSKTFAHLAQAHHEFEAKNGHAPGGSGGYDTAKLREHYLKWGKFAADIVFGGTYGIDAHGHDWLLHTIKIAKSGRSPVIEARLDKLAHASDPAEQKQLVREITIDTDTMRKYTEALHQAKTAQEGKGPTTMDSIVAGTDLTVAQVKAAAEKAHKCYTDFKAAHFAFVNDLEAAATALKSTYDGAKHLQAAYNFVKHYTTFAETVSEKQALASASGAIIGPIGPIAGELAIMAELCALLAEMLDAVIGLCDVLGSITGAKSMSKESAAVGKVKTGFDYIHKALLGIQTNAKPLVELGNKINRLLGRKK